jgi:hypothetical protein
MTGIEKLALALYHNKGVYALLLGSGMSQSARMPTGWDVTLDLVQEWAVASMETITGTPTEWYEAKVGSPPDYSKVLENLANTPADRNALLRPYFTPTVEELDQQIKVPQDGHRAIAELVSAGYVRVILTTNFDDLLEKALSQLGVDYQVIAKAADLAGAIPLAHAACTVIKLHGDYRDAGIRNTVAELSKYDPEMRRLLRRVLEEYGLVVCGWSGDYDIALRKQLKKPKRKYSTYWASRSALKAVAAKLAAVLSAELITITSADQFFRSLAETVKALDDTKQNTPLSAKTAAALVKRYIVDDRHRILLSDLVLNEARRVHEATKTLDRSTSAAPETPTELEKRLHTFESETRTLMSIMATGCYWGESHHQRFWGQTLRRVSHFQMLPGGRWDPSHYILLYPGLLALYAGGIAALAAERYDTLAALMLHQSWPHPVDKLSTPVLLHVVPERSLTRDLLQRLPQYSSRILAVSEHLKNASGVREATQEAWQDDDNFDDLFDWFEFLLGMVNRDKGHEIFGHWFPYRGSFIYRHSRSGRLSDSAPSKRFLEEIKALDDQWPPLMAGFFDGDPGRANEAYRQYAAAIDGVPTGALSPLGTP